MNDLGKFLSARLDERLAELQRRGVYAVGHTEGCVFDYEGTGACDCGAVGRALADVTAVRCIVRRYHGHLRHIESRGTLPSNALERDAMVLARDALTPLAQPHAEHPDFDPQWRV